MRITDVSPADEAKVVELTCQMIDKAADTTTTEASWRLLTEFFYAVLCYEFHEQHERRSLSIDIVKWAEAGHPAADRAIRRFGREMGERSCFDQMLVSVRKYYLDMAEKPLIPFPRGRHVVQHLTRDIFLPALAARVAEGTGLERTRSGGNPTPSAAYFIHLAYAKRGVKLSEREINRICWRWKKLPAELEASMPEIPQ